MAMGPLTIGRPTEAKINSTSNDSNGRTTKGVTALRSLPLISAVVQMLLTMTTRHYHLIAWNRRKLAEMRTLQAMPSNQDQKLVIMFKYGITSSHYKGVSLKPY